MRKLKASVVFFAASLCVVRAGATELDLVATLTAPGCFLTADAIYANENYLFAASYQGILFVYDRKAPDFPLVASIRVSARPLYSVRGDAKHVYVTSMDGDLYVYADRAPFDFIAAQHLGLYGLMSVAVDKAPKGDVFVSTAQAQMAVNGDYIYLTELNPGDVSLRIDKANLATQQTYGQVAEPMTTVAYDRRTGEQVGFIGNPLDLFGTSGAAEIYADAGMVMLTRPGCCGAGVYILDSKLTGISMILWPWSNTVATMHHGSELAIGTEAGTVDIYDISDPRTPVQRASINLRAVTGHYGIDDIEIRALWVDKDLIYAASSWSPQTKAVPSIFVLRYVDGLTQPQ